WSGRRPTPPRRPAAGRGRLGRRALRLHPSLLTGDLLALLDDGEVDEARERMGEQQEIFFPVARRVRERFHLLGGQREGDAIALAGRQLQLADDRGPTQSGTSAHRGEGARRRRVI